MKSISKKPYTDETRTIEFALGVIVGGALTGLLIFLA